MLRERIKTTRYTISISTNIEYTGEQLIQTYKPDFICYDSIIVELKAVKEIANEHQAQVINYLKVTDLKLGLLVNFGSFPKAEIKKLINN